MDAAVGTMVLFSSLAFRADSKFPASGSNVKVVHVGVFAVVFSASANFFISAWLCGWAAVTSDASCRSLVCGRCRGRDGLDVFFGFPR